jgi:hypothetical protein
VKHRTAPPDLSRRTARTDARAHCGHSVRAGTPVYQDSNKRTYCAACYRRTLALCPQAA